MVFPRSPRSRPDVWWRAGIVTVSVAIVVKLFSPSIADPDLWGHVLFGQLAGAVGWIPRFDPYSYLSIGKDWINHEWLTEHLFAAAFDAAGTPGLIGLKVGAAAAMVSLLIWHLSDRGLDVLRAAVLVVLLSIPLLLGMRTVRPHLFTYLFFTFTLLVLVRSEGTGGGRLLLLIPIFVVWTNMHGGVLAGLGVVGLWAGVAIGRSAYARLRSLPAPGKPSPWVWIAALGGSGAAMVVNPYGAELLEFLVTTATVPRPFITEWQPLGLRSERGVLWLGATVLAAWAVLRSDRRPSPEALVVLGVLVLLPLTAVRHLALTFLAIPILAAEAFAGLWGGEEATSSTTARQGWIGAGLAAAAIPVLFTAADDLDCIEINPELEVVYPARATAWLQDSGVEADLITYFNYGEYVLWHLGPRVRVGMDGRRETVYPDSVYDSYMRFQHGRDDWDRYLSMGDPDLAMLRVGLPADNLLELHDAWSVVYADSLVRVHSSGSGPVDSALAVTPVPDLPADGHGLCFP